MHLVSGYAFRLNARIDEFDPIARLS